MKRELVGCTVGVSIAFSASVMVYILSLVVVLPAPRPVPTPPVVPAVPPMQRNLDYRTNTDALLDLPQQLRQVCAWTGRIRFLVVENNHTAVVHAEIEGGGIDVVVFSFGQVIRNPMPLDAESRARLESELFPLISEHLRSIPPAVHHAIQARPLETEVEQVMLTAIAGDPRMELKLVHPRRVFEPVRVPLVFP